MKKKWIQRKYQLGLRREKAEEELNIFMNQNKRLAAARVKIEVSGLTKQIELIDEFINDLDMEVIL